MRSRRCLVTAISMVFACTQTPDAEVAKRTRETSTGETAQTDSARVCFISSRSVLARSSSAGAPGPANLRGWIRLDHFHSLDSAAAQLVDSDGFALDAAWMRTDKDLIVVIGSNDFVRIDMRLRQSGESVIGTLSALSDAALERDSTGTLRAFRRNLTVRLREAACDSMPRPAGQAAVDLVPHGTPRPGLRFDPSSLRRGQLVGALVADSIETRVAAVDNTYVGIARFRGTLELTGWTLRHPDPDLRHVLTCFEADSESAARMPRWMGDERRAWFCFSNRSEAAWALGPPSEGVPFTIVIDDFTIYRGHSDEVNSARFVRLVRSR